MPLYRLCKRKNQLHVILMIKQIAIPNIYCQLIRENIKKKINSHYFLLTMFGKWTGVLGNGGRSSAIFVELWNASECIAHDPLMIKPSLYVFGHNSRKLINSFLNGKKLRWKIGSSYTPSLNLLLDVPQGSMMDLLFSQYIHMQFFFYPIESLKS